MKESDVRDLIHNHSVDVLVPLPTPVATALLLAQIRQESNFNEKAVSPAGAQGLAQFMPGTWQTWGGDGDPFNPEDSIKAQLKYMNHLYGRFGEIPNALERYKFALASYNAGRGHINEALSLARESCGLPHSYNKWKSQGARRGLWQEWWYTSEHLERVTGRHSRETLQYVSLIFNYALLYLSRCEK